MRARRRRRRLPDSVALPLCALATIAFALLLSNYFPRQTQAIVGPVARFLAPQ